MGPPVGGPIAGLSGDMKHLHGVIDLARLVTAKRFQHRGEVAGANRQLGACVGVETEARLPVVVHGVDNPRHMVKVHPMNADLDPVHVAPPWESYCLWTSRRMPMASTMLRSSVTWSSAGA